MPNDADHRELMTDTNVSGEETIVDTFGREDIQRLLDDHQRLLVLYGFTNVISTILDVELLLNEAMNVVFGLVRADRGAIFLLAPKTGLLVRGASRTKEVQGIQGAKGKGSHGVSNNAIIEWVLREKKTILTPDASKDPRFQNAQDVQSEHIQSALCVPLTSQHRVVGVLYVDNQKETSRFSKEQLTLLSGIANQTAVALENIESVSRLKEERKRVEDILKTLPVSIISIDEKEMISFVNPRAERLFGQLAKSYLGRSYRSFFESNRFRPLLNLITPALEKGKGVVLQEVACGTPEDQTLLQVDIVLLKEGIVQRGVLVVLDDVTEKKNLEREIQHVEKLSAIGEMTAGLVHEINNPLNIISGRAQLLLLERADDSEASKAARIIWEQVDRASAITEKLLSFARQRPPQLQPLLLNEFLAKYLETMEEEFSSGKVRVEKELTNTPMTVMGDPDQLEEVFVNLARNAIQAMPKGGTFSVVTRNKGTTAEILLTDTGCGILPEHLSKIFVPFFTTKNRGTGLGLSIVHGIVRNHQGVLKVESEVGKGTTFMMTLPLKKEEEP